MTRKNPPKEIKEKVYTLAQLEKVLTGKQKVFCHEYIRDWNGSRSAKAAGYSHASAELIASENIRKPYLKQYIEYIKEDIAKEVGISKIGLLSELKFIATSDIGDIYDTWITRKELEDLKETHPTLSKAIQEISTKTQNVMIEKEMVEIEYVKIKLYNKLQAIQDIFKAMGWNAAEKHEVINEVTTKVDISKYSKKEKKMLLKIARKNEYIQE